MLIIASERHLGWAKLFIWIVKYLYDSGKLCYRSIYLACIYPGHWVMCNIISSSCTTVIIGRTLRDAWTTSAVRSLKSEIHLTDSVITSGNHLQFTVCAAYFLPINGEGISECKRDESERRLTAPVWFSHRSRLGQAAKSESNVRLLNFQSSQNFKTDVSWKTKKFCWDV